MPAPTSPKAVADIAAVARLEEARIAQAFADLADDSRPLAGGVMAVAGPRSWLNAVVGAGMTGPVTDADIDAIIAFYTGLGVEPRVEVCTLADASLVAGVAKAGFVLKSFDNVLFRPIRPEEVMKPPYPAPDELVIETVNPADAAAVREYALTSVSGFLPPGELVSEDVLDWTARAVRHPRSISFVVRLPHEAGSTPVAAGGMEVSGEISCLYGLSVAPPFRRRGIQQALIAHRLRIAADHGANYATIGSRPGTHTERNVRRMGFELAYTKVCVAKPGPGLVGSRES